MSMKEREGDGMYPWEKNWWEWVRDRKSESKKRGREQERERMNSVTVFLLLY